MEGQKEIGDEELDYMSPTNLKESLKLLEEIEGVSGNIFKVLDEKKKSIYDIQDTDGLENKHIVLREGEDHFFISLTFYIGLYKNKFDYKFKGESREDVINKLNIELKKDNFEVPIDSDDWR